MTNRTATATRTATDGTAHAATATRPRRLRATEAPTGARPRSGTDGLAPVDPALDEALDRISELAARLWAVRSAHRPVVTGWRRETRCAECGQAVPCTTLRAVG